MRIRKFYIYYGGYDSHTWEVTWKDNELRYTHYDYFPESYTVIDFESRLPDFINALTTITASWLPTYDTDTSDGIQWEINIHADKHRFKYYGSNAWPENFGEVVEAMREFLGDEGFAGDYQK